MKNIYMDIHTHILPGVDDGSRSMEETLNMVKKAYDEGVRTMIATPHYGVINCGYSDGKAIEVFRRVIAEAKASCPEMRFIMGNEIYYSQGIADDLIAGKARSLGNSSYVLVEFSTEADTETMKRALQEFTFNGYRLIIAHVERYRYLRHNLKAVRELVESGAYVQINCRSITDRGLGQENRARWCRKLLKADLVHFVASDCHDDVKRKPVFGQAVKIMIKYIGEERTSQIINGNIVRLIKNESIS